MISSIFNTMYSSGALKYFGAFLWGVASVLLSPCGISTVPLVVGYVANSDSPSHWQAFKISCAFCLGIIMNLVLIGFITSSIGLLLGGYERFLTLITAAVFIIMGLHMLGVLRVKFFSLGSRNSLRTRCRAVQYRLRESGAVSGDVPSCKGTRCAGDAGGVLRSWA